MDVSKDRNSSVVEMALWTTIIISPVVMVLFIAHGIYQYHKSVITLNTLLVRINLWITLYLVSLVGSDIGREIYWILKNLLS